jgi:hypothetical protein
LTYELVRTVPVLKFSISVQLRPVGFVDPDWLMPPIHTSPVVVSAPVAADIEVPVPPLPDGFLSLVQTPGMPMIVARIFWLDEGVTVTVSDVVRPLLFEVQANARDLCAVDEVNRVHVEPFVSVHPIRVSRLAAILTTTTSISPAAGAVVTGTARDAEEEAVAACPTTYGTAMAHLPAGYRRIGSVSRTRITGRIPPRLAHSWQIAIPPAANAA